MSTNAQPDPIRMEVPALPAILNAILAPLPTVARLAKSDS